MGNGVFDITTTETQYYYVAFEKPFKSVPFISCTFVCNKDIVQANINTPIVVEELSVNGFKVSVNRIKNAAALPFCWIALGN